MSIDAITDAEAAYQRQLSLQDQEAEKNEYLISKLASVTFLDGFAMIRGDAYWIGIDGCEYDDPFDYLENGSPIMMEKTEWGDL